MGSEILIIPMMMMVAAMFPVRAVFLASSLWRSLLLQSTSVIMPVLLMWKLSFREVKLLAPGHAAWLAGPVRVCRERSGCPETANSCRQTASQVLTSPPGSVLQPFAAICDVTLRNHYSPAGPVCRQFSVVGVGRMSTVVVSPEGH